jgi:hypothetical protein
VTKSLSVKERKEIRSRIGVLQAEIRHCHSLLGDGYIIGPWLLEAIRKSKDPQWLTRACWLCDYFTARSREEIDSGLKRGDFRAVDWMDNLYEIVVKSAAFTREMAEAAAQAVIGHHMIHEATSPRLRTGPDKHRDFYWCGKQYPIRGKEFGLLRYVWYKRGRVAKVVDIYRKVWESNDEVGTDELACVEGTVKRLRKKLQNTPVAISFSRADEIVSIEICLPAMDE